MATIDIGKIKPVFKGTYDNSTAYVLDDIVYYNGSSYVAKTSTTGNLPTDTTKWNILASGSGGIWDSTLSIGSAEQVVRVNSGATALEFADASGGYVIQEKVGYYSGTTTTSFSNQTPQWLGSINSVYQTGSSVSITPTSASNKIHCKWQVPFGGDQYGCFLLYREIGGTGGYTQLSGGSHWGNSTGDPYQLFTAEYWDTPNTTSAIVYRIYARNHDGNSWNVNDMGGYGSKGAGIFLSVKEVDGSKLTIST